MMVSCLLVGSMGLTITGAVLVVIVETGGRVVVRLNPAPRACGHIADWVGEASALPESALAGEPHMTGEAPYVTGEPPHMAREPVMTGAGQAPDFWASLSRMERQTLLAVSTARTYRDGAEIFRQGALADHVVIVRSGWARISKRAPGGGEHTLAVRGRGQLLGERGALAVKSRSASAFAMGTVRAWTTRTADFAAFISEYPHVLDLIEQQIYDRLGEPPGQPLDRMPVLAPASAPVESEQVWAGGRDPFLRPHDSGLNGEHCTIVMTDVAGFSTPQRNDDDRLAIRRVGFEAVRKACHDAGIPWRSCHWEDRGDGLMVIIPPLTTTAAVIRSLPALIADTLYLHNNRSSDAGRIKLRLAVNVGPVTSDPIGVSGNAIIHASRLLDAQPLRRRLAAGGGCLGVIVSEHVFESVIRDGAATSPDDFERVQCKVKQSRVTGWIALYGRSGEHPS